MLNLEDFHWHKCLLTDLHISEALIDPSLVLAMRGIEVVLDAVVRAARKLLRNISPLVAQLFVQIKNLFLLNFVNRSLIDVRIEVIVPSEQEMPLLVSTLGRVICSVAYLSRHCLPVRVRILNFSSSLLATKVHFLVPYSLTSSTIAASSYTASQNPSLGSQSSPVCS